ncbi:MAG TPA: S9 family peptidase [Bryobacteraceae bacterium]|nr:S9 family peptidase [Bryobacteraceae bacterium]
MTRFNRLPPSILAVALLAAGWLFAAGGRPIAETDLYAFQWIASPRISPDSARIIYTHVTVNAKHDGYETALWIIPSSGGAARQLTSGPRDSSPEWSPDGKMIAFVRAAEKDGRPQPAQIYLLAMEGGEARPLTDLPKGAGGPVWSPDGRMLAFSSTTVPDDFNQKKDGEEKSDVRVITKAVYRSNGEGYLDPDRPSHIWTVEVPKSPGDAQKARQLTSGEFSENGMVWSRDSSRIYFTTRRVVEPYYDTPQTDLYAVQASGGDITKITGLEGEMERMALSPDGTRMAFAGSIDIGKDGVERSYSQPDLFVTSLQPGSRPKNLTVNYDYDMAGGVGGDQAPPRGNTPSKPFWSRDGRFVYVLAAEEGRANLKRIDAETGKVEPLTEGDHDLFSYDATPDGAHAALLISTPTNIGDLFVLDVASRQMRRLTHLNEDLLAKLNLTAPVMIWYQSFDGKRIQAWVQRPPDFQEGKKYPLILNIHGGPHSAYGYTFDHEIQWMAAKGYVVLYPNPRGSTTYGQDFGNVIQYHYPGDDYKDLMAGVDELIARGWVDPEKLGVTGGSGGGLLTNWVIGQTTRFRAAVSQRSIADWADFWYTADFTLFTPSWFRGAPWEQQADFKARSPITYIDRIQTPLMLIEGEADYRTPPTSGGEQMFRALKYRKIPTAMVRFPGESHELSRSGMPRHRVERLEHILAWFDKYLQGQEIHTYDVR